MLVYWQSISLSSVPAHATSSRTMAPVPCPKKALKRARAPVSENPACLQATEASTVPQESSHTVPQSLFTQTSTRPSVETLPPTRRTSPLEQTTVDQRFKCKIITYTGRGVDVI